MSKNNYDLEAAKTMVDGKPKCSWTFVYKISKTLYIDVTWICLGMLLEVNGATLQDLKTRVNCNYEEIGRALVGRSIGFFIGSLTGGVLWDRFPKYTDLFSVGALLIGSTGTMIIPWCRVLELLWACFVLQGFCEGNLAVGANAMFIRLWKEKAAPAVYSLHFSYGIGASLAPIVAAPFLSPDTTLNSNATLNATLNSNATLNATLNSNVTTELSATFVPQITDSRIEIAYIIIGILAYCSSGIAFVFFCITPPPGVDMKEVSTKLKGLFSPGRCAMGDKLFGSVMFVMLFFFYLFLVGGDRSTGRFLFSYATDNDLKFSKLDAAFLNSAYWICYTTGRGLPMVYAKFIPSPIILCTLLVCYVITTIVMSIFGHQVRLMLWITVCLFGLINGPIFGTGISWANRYLEVTGLAVAVLYTGSATGGFIFQWLTGYLFQYQGARSYTFVLVGCGSIMLVIYVIMQIISSRHGTRFNPSHEVDEKEKKISDDELCQEDKL